MLDTVAIVMNFPSFVITKPDLFEPSATGLLRAPYYPLRGGSFHCDLNPTRQELLNGLYIPRLTLRRRIVRGGYQLVLRIEFSVPKLLYKNNFDEVVDSQFEEVRETLKTRLKEKGILVSRSMLDEAPLSKIDYSKNIVLEKFSNSRMIINKLSKADMHLWLDLEVVKYRNAGYGVKYRNNGFELACYDKTKDLQKGKNSDKKSEEKDNAIQLDLLERLSERNSVEVFRIEARLNSRQKIRQTLKSLGIDAQPTFKELFNNSYSKQILTHYWQQLENGYKGLEYNPDTYSKLFSELAGHNPEKRLSILLKAVGIRMLIDELGVRGYRNLVSDFSKASWAGSRKTIQSLNMPTVYWSPLSQITTALDDFKPIKLADYEDNLYSNSK